LLYASDYDSDYDSVASEPKSRNRGEGREKLKREMTQTPEKEARGQREKLREKSGWLCHSGNLEW